MGYKSTAYHPMGEPQKNLKAFVFPVIPVIPVCPVVQKRFFG